MNDDELTRLLSKKRKDDLRKLAGELHVDYPATATKREIAVLIVNSSPSRALRALGLPRSYRFAFDRESRNDMISIFGLVAAIAAIVLSIYIFRVERSDLEPKPLSVDLVWYEMKDGRPRLLDGNQYRVTIDDRQFKEKALTVPVNLAVRNRTGEMLEVVSVQITYPSWLNVRSQGKGRIDAKGGSLVYSHQIGTLPPVDEFTPLETIDTLTIPFPVEVFPIFFKSSEGVPFHEWALWGGPKHELEGRELKLRFRVDCKGHQLMVRDLNLNMPFVFDLAGSKCAKLAIEPIGKAESENAARLISQANEELSGWSGKFSKDGSIIKFSRNRADKSVLQIIRVNEVIRRANVDLDGDGFLDFDYLDLSGDGLTDHRIKYETREEMVDWHPDSLKSNASE